MGSATRPPESRCAPGDQRTTWFTKTALVWYPLGVDAGAPGLVEAYLGLSLVQGLGNAWNVAESVVHGAGAVKATGKKSPLPWRRSLR